MPPHAAASDGYVSDVLSGAVPAGKWVKLAAERHLRDLKASKSKDWPYKFDAAKAERACRFIELLPHVKGRWAAGASKPLRLEPWQCFLTCSLFGWVNKKTVARRFRKARLYVSRKNGKSSWAAPVGLYMLCADGEPGAEVYSGATSEKQAWEVFGPAKEMAKRTPALVSQFGVTVNAKSLIRVGDMSKFEPVIGKPGDGSSPSCAILEPVRIANKRAWVSQGSAGAYRLPAHHDGRRRCRCDLGGRPNVSTHSCGVIPDLMYSRSGASTSGMAI